MIEDQVLLDALARNVLGLPAAVCTWRDLIRLRDTLDDLVNAAINERQLDLPGDGYPRDRRPAAQPEES